jgi:Fe2+ transport system protein B
VSQSRATDDDINKPVEHKFDDVIDNTEPPLRHNKARDRAMILPIVGVLLLVPPLAGIFQLDIKIAGVPFTLIYLFTVWAVLIAGAALLSRRLFDKVLSSAVDVAGIAEQKKSEKSNPR